MNALEDRLDIQPSAPQSHPSRRAIPLAVEIAAETGDGAPQIPGAHLPGWASGQTGNDLHDFGAHHLRRIRLWGVLSNLSQTQQAQGHRGEDRQQSRTAPPRCASAAARSGSRF